MRNDTSRSLKLSVAPVLATLLALAGCSTAPVVTETAPKPAPRASEPSIKAPVPSQPSAAPVLPPAGSGRGGYYQDDGPGENPPPNLDQVPDAEVRNDPLIARANKPYVVFGKTYTPITDNQPYSQIGVGSWYGKKFHGQRTSSGELYDMYKMTAAHPILPIPSYARLTNLVSGAQVVVRINDRGPFHSNRAIDVSYTAALKLGLLGKGSHELQIERILPDEVDRMLATKQGVSGTTSARLQTKPVTQASALSSSSLATNNQPLVLTPKPVQSSGAAPQEIQALMLGDRVPAGAADGAPSASSASSVVDPQAGSDGAAVKGGYYLQLGAYSRADNAEAARVRLARINGVGALEVTQGGTVFRIFSGPYASRQDALQAAQGLPASLGLKPIVIQR